MYITTVKLATVQFYYFLLAEHKLEITHFFEYIFVSFALRNTGFAIFCRLLLGIL
jgi:hypothetical protein